MKRFLLCVISTLCMVQSGIIGKQEASASLLENEKLMLSGYVKNATSSTNGTTWMPLDSTGNRASNWRGR